MAASSLSNIHILGTIVLRILLNTFGFWPWLFLMVTCAPVGVVTAIVFSFCLVSRDGSMLLPPDSWRGGKGHLFLVLLQKGTGQSCLMFEAPPVPPIPGAQPSLLMLSGAEGQES